MSAVALSKESLQALSSIASVRQIELYSKLRQSKFTPDSYQHKEYLEELMRVSRALGELSALTQKDAP